MFKGFYDMNVKSLQRIKTCIFFKEFLIIKPDQFISIYVLGMNQLSALFCLSMYRGSKSYPSTNALFEYHWLICDFFLPFMIISVQTKSGRKKIHFTMQKIDGDSDESKI